jgi:hypothetical protein
VEGENMSEIPGIEDLERMSIAELKELAAQRGVLGTGDFTKEELIEQIMPKEPVQVAERDDSNNLTGGEEPESGSCLLRGVGIALQVTAGLGILLNLILIIGVLVVARQQVPVLESGLQRGAEDLDAVAISIDAASTAMESVNQSLVTTSSLLDTTGDALSSLSPFLDTVALTVGTEVPEVIRSSQQSLQAAQSGARTIDGALRLISLIPLIGVDYDPERTLHSSLGAVVEDLDPLPVSMVQLQENLDTLSADVADIEVETREVSTRILDLSQDLEVLQASLQAQSESISALAEYLSMAAERVEALVMVAAGFMILLLIGISMGQVAAIYVGSRIGKG